NGGQTSIHTHPGPETIYVRAGPFEYQNALHGTETVQVGDVRSLPPVTPVQKRNPSSQQAAFLTLFVVDQNQPLAPEASFATTPAAQPAPQEPAPQPAQQQPAVPAALPNTGADQPLWIVLLGLSSVALIGGSAVRWRTASTWPRATTWSRRMTRRSRA
ncbi:MAG: LPXTG cell wall anchor domain-containing protein, partial [Chloroflexota bacterium]|nr:LPXTG cell wall anchor domain-containing protein [Chloroflexota bacterium]